MILEGNNFKSCKMTPAPNPPLTPLQLSTVENPIFFSLAKHTLRMPDNCRLLIIFHSLLRLFRALPAPPQLLL